jgi:hypothetical protein
MGDKADEIERSMNQMEMSRSTEEEAEDIATAVDNNQKNLTRPPFKNTKPAPVGSKPVKNTWLGGETALGL